MFKLKEDMKRKANETVTQHLERLLKEASKKNLTIEATAMLLAFAKCDNDKIEPTEQILTYMAKQFITGLAMTKQEGDDFNYDAQLTCNPKNTTTH